MEAILRGFDVVWDPAKADHLLFRVVDDVAGARVSIETLDDPDLEPLRVKIADIAVDSRPTEQES